jgi:hypothetical protein
LTEPAFGNTLRHLLEGVFMFRTSLMAGLCLAMGIAPGFAQEARQKPGVVLIPTGPLELQLHVPYTLNIVQSVN